MQITAPAQRLERSAQVTIAGTAGDASGDLESVRLTVHERSPDGPAVVGPTDVPRQGKSWSRTVTLPLAAGSRMGYVAVVTQADRAGNRSQPATRSFVAYVPPTPDPPPPPSTPDPPPIDPPPVDPPPVDPPPPDAPG